MTMNRTWAYAPTDTLWKPTWLLLRILARVAARGGNLLLNVGPDGAGRFPPQATERLTTIGRWTNAHAEAVYDTRYGRPLHSDAVVCTRHEGAIFLFLLRLPRSGVVPLDGLHYVPEHALLLDSGTELPILRTKGAPALGVSEVPKGLLLPVVMMR